ncbi:iron-containing alcohol dehydrogenase [Kitasatospora camelliae]|uniref:Iron-containing alcohol dehydrogenase n=1 Tax=Kitasatospora camelliae TaxID=3156397 RepID=A0AAU8K410_9ACTN
MATALPVEYEVRFTPRLLDPANPALAEAGSPVPGRRLLLVESTVHELYGDRVRGYLRARGVDHRIHVLPAHERLKTMESVFDVVAAMDRFGVSRRGEPVVAVGGGVLTDVVGLACSLYRRSTPFVRVPTTLIGLVDAGAPPSRGCGSRWTRPAARSRTARWPLPCWPRPRRGSAGRSPSCAGSPTGWLRQRWAARGWGGRCASWPRGPAAHGPGGKELLTDG